MHWKFHSTKRHDYKSSLRTEYFGPCPHDLIRHDELTGTEVEIDGTIYRVMGTVTFCLNGPPPRKGQKIGLNVDRTKGRKAPDYSRITKDVSI